MASLQKKKTSEFSKCDPFYPKICHFSAFSVLINICSYVGFNTSQGPHQSLKASMTIFDKQRRVS